MTWDRSLNGSVAKVPAVASSLDSDDLRRDAVATAASVRMRRRTGSFALCRPVLLKSTNAAQISPERALQSSHPVSALSPQLTRMRGNTADSGNQYQRKTERYGRWPVRFLNETVLLLFASDSTLRRTPNPSLPDPPFDNPRRTPALQLK